MRIALGVHVSTYEVTASLVDTSLPELGPIATRTVEVAATPGGIGGAVSAALGFMRVQAKQNDLDVAGAAVVCENAMQREIVADALAEVEEEPLPVVDIFDERLSDAFTPDVSAAMLVGDVAPVAVAAKKPRTERRGIWPVAAVGACVLAALGGVTAWAMTAAPSTPGEPKLPTEMVYPTGVVTSSPSSASGSIDPSVEPPAELQAPGVVPAIPSVPRTPVVDPTAPPAPQESSSSQIQPTPAPTTTTTPSAPGDGGGPVTTQPPVTPSTIETTTSAPEVTTTPETTEPDSADDTESGD